MNIEKLKKLHNQMCEATGKVGRELSRLNELAENNSDVKKRIRAYMNHLETRDGWNQLPGDFLSEIEKLCK